MKFTDVDNPTCRARIHVFVAGKGVAHARSSEILKTDEAMRQLEALGRLIERGVISVDR